MNRHTQAEILRKSNSGSNTTTRKSRVPASGVQKDNNSPTLLEWNGLWQPASNTRAWVGIIVFGIDVSRWKYRIRKVNTFKGGHSKLVHTPSWGTLFAPMSRDPFGLYHCLTKLKYLVVVLCVFIPCVVPYDPWASNHFSLNVSVNIHTVPSPLVPTHPDPLFVTLMPFVDPHRHCL